MIENRKTELVEEDENNVANDVGFFKVGGIIIGVIAALMIICGIMIVILENC